MVVFVHSGVVKYAYYNQASRVLLKMEFSRSKDFCARFEFENKKDYAAQCAYSVPLNMKASVASNMISKKSNSYNSCTFPAAEETCELLFTLHMGHPGAKIKTKKSDRYNSAP